MFQRSMQDLIKKLEIPIAGRIGTQTGPAVTGHVFQIEVIEGAADNVAFCIKLGLAVDALSASDLRKLLAQNLPQTGASPNIVGLHPKGQEFCLWCRESIENLKPSLCIDILNRLVRQAEELRNYFDAPAACTVDSLTLAANTNFDQLQ
ncbi:MAG: hypothetical protein JWQ10_3854 [Herbaspirillum sp.]|nr:hypothetical protein [Herbaspirillum sp.]